MTDGPKVPTTPKAPAALAAPKVPEPKIITELVPTVNVGAILATLVVGLVIGVGVYYVLTHVMIEDADNA